MKAITPALGFLLLVLFTQPVLAQQDITYTLQRIDSRNGLSNSSVNAIFQGDDKILWVGTWDGLNSFNGSSFKTFSYSQDHRRGIGNNVVEDITEDAEHHIWVCTVEGISRYKPSTGEFTHYFYNAKGKNVSEKQFILLTDHNRIPYVYSVNSGLQRFDSASASFQPVPLILPGKKIKQLLFTGNDLLWVLLENGHLGSFRQANGKMEVRDDFGSFTGIHSMYELDGQLVITTSDGRVEKLSGNQRVQLNHFPEAIKLITPYEQHYIIAWEKKGCLVVDKDFRPSDFLQKEMNALRELQINTIHTGSGKILWLGTDGNGMAKIAPVRKPFTLVSNTDAGLRDDKQVRTFEKVGNELWVGTKGNGILAIPFPIDKNAAGRRFFTEASGLSNNAVYAIRQVNEEWTYIGSDGDGIALYNNRKKQFYSWKQIKGSNAYLFRSVYTVLPDKDGSVWLGTSGYGLIHLRIEGETPTLTYFKQYTFNGTENGPASDIIFSLTKDHKDRIWAGCRYGGVSILDKNTERFTTIRSGDSDTSLSHNDVLYILADSRHQMWIGTSYGLNRIENDFEGKPFQRFTTAQGLPNNTIHGIAEDSQGMIWVSTNNGLARVIRGSNDVIRFSESDGLQSNEFSDGAVWKGPDGSLFFGGIYGFNYCEPWRILINTAQPNLQVTGIQLGGQSPVPGGYMVLRPDAINSSAEYTLSRYHNYFDLSIKAIDFINTGKSEYAYRLDGFDKNWHFPGSSGYISYGNLPAGDYVLKVKWSNGEGQWTPEETLMMLTVEQYLWLTPAAFLLYYVLAVIFIYVVYTYRKSKTDMKHKLELEYKLRLKEEKLHAEKLDFFTNIAHELQTPLTLIMGTVEHQQQQVKDDNRSSGVLSLVHQQASRLAYLIEQLMEFRKAEEGHLKAHYLPLAASVFLGNIARLFVHFREYNNIEYDYEIEESIFISSDPDKLEKIIFNLLSNAFKYTSAGEKIHFHVYRNQEKNEMEILVANSGHNVPAAEMEKLFDKFFTGNASREKFSSGLGLAFTRQLVSLLNGKITAYCKDNWACFKVVLPVSSYTIQETVPRPLQPSLLIRTIAQEPAPGDTVSSTVNNKAALLQSLEQADRPIILVVEDEAPIRQLLRNLLIDKYIVYEAPSGKEALACMINLTPHLIISDIMMEDMNGLELCKRVKNIPGTCHIPFLILSARGSTDQQHEGYEAGADAYLPKPFHTQHLLGRVQQLLDNRKRLHDYFRNKALPGSEVPQGLNEADKEFLEKLLAVITAELNNPELDSSHLETKMAISRMQLYRKIKTISGMTPAEFIRNIRLQKAAELLATTRLTVSEIFFQTGFNNQSYFFREFKKKYQCSPNEYRLARMTRIAPE
ncbi:MAG: hybrid sensor histidine kinase/response regulator [Chitinophagaceae bacterium]|jgi:signal transduction histidine kinase/DNA-binding response OmpR family regulator/ligand-binding sensor domain-containing protein|nr:MAG: hybrid sensor histidine kinase/response regulator [Chitinophagaceae bacterium]